MSEYFITTPYVASALAGRRNLFLGRKGSGKSALFSQLSRLVEDRSELPRTVRLLTPDQYAWSALAAYREQGVLAEQAHMNAWRLTLAVEAAGALLELEDVDWLEASAASLGRVRTFLTDNFGRIAPGLQRTAQSIVKGLKSFNLTAFGFGAGLTRETPPEVTLTPALADEIMRHLEQPLLECGLILALDRLDDSWDGSPESRSLLVGLLKASKDFNDRFRTEHPDLGLRVDVFLRSDIYDDLRFDDKDKHRQTEESLSWTTEQLEEMIQRRLPAGITVSELFEQGEMRDSITPFSYIVKRTFLRPREVLQFLEECKRQAGQDSTVISKDDVRAAEEKYSRWKVDDLKQEFARAVPDFDEIIETLRQEVHRYDSLDELVAMISRKAPDLVEAKGGRQLLETLFDCSVIGVRLGDAGSTRFKAEDSDLALPQAGAVYVHQSLYRGLNIKEARKATGEGRENGVGELLHLN